MAVSELLMEGLGLLVVGMGTVFVFLALLVIAVSLMSKMAHHLAPPLAQGADQKTVLAQEAQRASSHHIAAITAAVSHYRAKRHS